MNKCRDWIQMINHKVGKQYWLLISNINFMQVLWEILEQKLWWKIYLVSCLIYKVTLNLLLPGRQSLIWIQNNQSHKQWKKGVPCKHMIVINQEYVSKVPSQQNIEADESFQLPDLRERGMPFACRWIFSTTRSMWKRYAVCIFQRIITAWKTIIG